MKKTLGLSGSALTSRADRKRRGNVIVMMALSMTVLLGMVGLAVDYGVLVADDNQLQRGCDAGAIAGANRLDGKSSSVSAATTRATDMAAQNSVASPTITVTNGYTRIRVEASRNRSLTFMKLLGVESKTVTAHATAESGYINSGRGGVPLAMTINDFNLYKNGTENFILTLERNQNNAFDNNGEILGISLGAGNSKTVAQWGNDIYASNDSISVGEELLSLNAQNYTAQDKQFVDNLTARWNENRRKFVMMITDPKPSWNGNSFHTVLGLVAVEMITLPVPASGKGNSSTGPKQQLRILTTAEAIAAGFTDTGLGTNATTNMRLARFVDDL